MEGFKVIKKLTFPQLKLTNDNPVYFKFTGKMFTGKAIHDPKLADDKQKNPPILARGVDLSTGAECEMICNAVLQSVLDEEYPEGAYVEKSFEITKHKKVEGKAYNRFSVTEIEVPENKKASTKK